MYTLSESAKFGMYADVGKVLDHALICMYTPPGHLTESGWGEGTGLNSAAWRGCVRAGGGGGDGRGEGGGG